MTKAINTKLCFLGGGNMARSMISGMLSAGFNPQNIWVTARTQDTCNKLKSLGKINVSQNNLNAIQEAELIFLAVKPKDLASLVEQIKPKLTTKQIIISLAARVNIKTLSAYLNPNNLIIRAMPNTPVQVTQGIYGLYAEANIDSNIKNQLTNILVLTGKTVWLESEAALDKLTSISGCGPAYVFMLIASLEHAAIHLGLPQDQAKILAAQTVAGAAGLALNSTESAQQLCQNVCSPGGMTERGVRYLEENSFGNIIEQAIQKTAEYLHK